VLLFCKIPNVEYVEVLLSALVASTLCANSILLFCGNYGKETAQRLYSIIVQVFAGHL